jgi:uncharacterized protein YukE
MPSFGSFEQLRMYFSQIDAASPSTSAQANWLAGAAEAQELAAELTQNVAVLKEFWSGPAATEFYTAMDAIVEFATSLATDMLNMSNGLTSMAMMAATIQPQALSIIAAAQSNPYSRAAAIAPLNALLNQLGGSYLTDRGQYWKEPTQPPERLPKSGNDGTVTPTKPDKPQDVPSSPILGTIRDIAQAAGLIQSAYEAFKPDDFPSGVTGDIPPGSTVPGGTIPGWDGGDGGSGSDPGSGTGPISPDDPDYQPLPEPTDDLTESPVELAGATPVMTGGPPPAVSLAVGGGAQMGSPGGAMPMMGGMGMGMAGAAANSAPKAAPARSTGGGGAGMMGAPMGAARRGGDDGEEEGVRTWLTEDELTWDTEPAPSGIVGK